jgi:6-phosphofructokinase
MTRPQGEEFKYQFKWFKDDFDTDPRTRGRSFTHRSQIEELRSGWEPPLPEIFNQPFISIQANDTPLSIEAEVLKKWPEFDGMTNPITLDASKHPMTTRTVPPRVGIILTGEWVPSSGTHNVIIGIVRYVCERIGGEVLGFLGGPQGFARSHYIELTPEKVRNYLNQGGADLLGFGSLRAIDQSDYAEIIQLCKETYKLTSLVFIGGPNELAHVAQLIQLSVTSSDEYPTMVGVFQSPNSNVFQPTWIPVTLGYDSTRSALAELVGNIALDGLSSGRPNEVNIIRCGSTTMTMEVALHVGPAMTILADDLKARNIGLNDLVASIEHIARKGLKTATILMSDKFYQCLPVLSQLQAECRDFYISKPTFSPDDLTPSSRELFLMFPPGDQRAISRAYDSDGRPTWPETEPEKFLAYLLTKRDASLIVRTHNVGQEARCPLPTNFDCSLGLALGYTAGALSIDPRCHGYVAGVKNLVSDSPRNWVCGGIPIATLLSVRKADSSILTNQFGGANQELINLARQRVLREASVPLIALRPMNILSDCFYKQFTRLVEDDTCLVTRQPGPYQFTETYDRKLLPLALVVACGEDIKNWLNWKSCWSPLEIQRMSFYKPQCPSWLLSGNVTVRDSVVTTHRSGINVLQLAFPRTYAVSAVRLDPGPQFTERTKMTVGVVFLGRPAAGCHNILYGLVQSLGNQNRLVGFVNGAAGLLSGKIIELTPELVEDHRNLSGIDILGRTEMPIRTSSELAACARTCRKHRLDGLVVVGGVGTHADTALLAERLPTRVIGVPASIENDIPLVERSLGHDTACRVYASVVGALGTLVASSKRQWCFVRIAGRSLSHIIGEIARMTHPNLVILSEEIEGWSLADLVSLVADLITERARNGFDFGLVIFPESVLDNLEEIKRFSNEMKQSGCRENMTLMSQVVLDALPERARAHTGRLVDPEILLESLVGERVTAKKDVQCLSIQVGIQVIHSCNFSPSKERSSVQF